jgi:DeoR/GlpR family transcriptional regulator of sugar metabolism
LIGGTVDPAVGGCVDASAVQKVEQMNIDRCFIGACAISKGSGLSVFDLADATFKRAVLASSQHGALLALTDKFATRAPYKVATIREIECIVVEHDLAQAERVALSKSGATVVVAQARAPAQDPARVSA